MGDSEIYVSLDIGIVFVKVIIVEMVDDRFNIIGVGNVEFFGIKKGIIIDIDKIVEFIKKVIE